MINNINAQALASSAEEGNLGPEATAAALKALMGRLLMRSPHLWEDPLYQAVIEHTGNSFQAMKSHP